MDTAFAQVGTTEKSNRNDGRAINKYALTNGGHYGDAYCSWGVLYCHKQNGVKPKTDGRASSWMIPEKSIIRKYGKVIRNITVKQGDVALTYYAPHWHVELITNYNTNTDYFYTVGFNTSGTFDNKKKRQGVWIQKRNKKNTVICNQLQFFWNEKATVHSIADNLLWLQSSRLPTD